jgi:hypothetical protein
VLLAWFDVLFNDVSALIVVLLELGDVEDVVAELFNEVVLDGLYVEVLLVDDEGDELMLMFVSLLEDELLGALTEDWL